MPWGDPAIAINFTDVAITGGSITGITDLTVADGGTGVSTLTDGGIMLGSGTGAVTVTARPTNGQILIGSTGVDPVVASITGTSNQITVTLGAGTITLSLPQSIHSAANPTFAALAVTTLNALTLTSQTVGFTIAGGTTSKTLTVALDANVAGTNTGDITLAATNHGLGLTNQVITLGTPSSVTGASTNSVTTTTHTHALDLTAPGAIGGTTPATAITTQVQTVKTTPTHGGMITQTYYATAAITAVDTVTIQTNVPTGALILGCQLHVKTALHTGETWNAQYVTGATQSIATAQAVAQNTNVNKFFDTFAATEIASAEVDITIQRSSVPGVDIFTAEGEIEAVVYAAIFNGWTNE